MVYLLLSGFIVTATKLETNFNTAKVVLLPAQFSNAALTVPP